MGHLRRFSAEGIGTFIVVFAGAGAAALGGRSLGAVGIALAFGLAYASAAMALGSLSGAHFNPGVTVAAALSGRFPMREALPVIAAQTAGATLGVALAFVIASGRPGGAPGFLADLAGGVGKNSPGFYGTNAALVSEIGLSAILAFVLLGALTRGGKDKTNSHVLTAAAGGLGLALVQLVGAPVTGMPANPARAVGVALLSPLPALKDLWIFVLGPMIGGAIAAMALRLAFGKTDLTQTNQPSPAPHGR